MSAFFSTLSCCWFWLLLGVLIGWLLNRWLCKCSHKPNQIKSTPLKKPEPSPPAKLADTPAPTTIKPVSTVAAPIITTPAVTVESTPKPALKAAGTAIDIAAA